MLATSDVMPHLPSLKLLQLVHFAGEWIVSVCIACNKRTSTKGHGRYSGSHAKYMQRNELRCKYDRVKFFHDLFRLSLSLYQNQEVSLGLFRDDMRRMSCAWLGRPRSRADRALMAAPGSIPAKAISSSRCLLSRRTTPERKLSNLEQSEGNSNSDGRCFRSKAEQ